jgi:hypothetical protein
MTKAEGITQRPLAAQDGDDANVFAGILGTLEQKLQPPYGSTTTAQNKAANLLTSIEGEPDLSDDKMVDATELSKYLGNVANAQAQRYIDTFDQDGDHKLNQTELAVMFGAEQPKDAGGPKQAGGGNGGGEGGGSGGGGGGSEATGGASGTSGMLQVLMQVLGIDASDGLSDEEKKKLGDFVKKYAGGDGQLDTTELRNGLKIEASVGNINLSPQQIDSAVKGLETQIKTADTDGKAGISTEELAKVLGTEAGVEADV